MDSIEVKQKIEELEARAEGLLKDGRLTSEFLLAKIAMALGVVVAALPQVADFVGVAGRLFPQSETVKIVLVVLAAATPLLTSLLYTVTRWKLKLAVINAVTPPAPLPAIDVAKNELLK